MIENRRNRANVAVHPSANLPPDLRSCSRRLEIGKGPRTKDRWKIPPSVSKVETIAEPGQAEGLRERATCSLTQTADGCHLYQAADLPPFCNGLIMAGP